LALRLGYWREPYHALVNENLDSQTLFGFVDQNGDFVQGFRPNFFLQRFEKDQDHITAGMGLSLGRSIALDIAGDFAEDDSTVSFSGIYRF
jgi:hypothetical protein